MYYTYILRSKKSHIFYFCYCENLKKRLKEHDQGMSKATKPHRPWDLVFYAAFSNKKQAKDLEKYLKTGSGKAFAYKRLVSEVLAKDYSVGNKKVL